MSLSPFSRDNRPLNTPSSSSLTPPKLQSSEPLTLSQALIITAGLAGLIGLLSGGIMRFSLAKSSNARFLSPLQTFPTLSNWSSDPASESPAGRSDSLPLQSAEERDPLESWNESSDLDWDTGRDFDEFSSEGFTTPSRASELTLEDTENLEQFSTPESALPNESVIPSDFDEFADRQKGRDRITEDPLKSLSEGPLLRTTELDLPITDDSYLGDPYSDNTYSDDAYLEDPYLDDPYSNGENFSEQNLSEERF